MSWSSESPNGNLLENSTTPLLSGESLEKRRMGTLISSSSFETQMSTSISEFWRKTNLRFHQIRWRTDDATVAHILPGCKKNNTHPRKVHLAPWQGAHNTPQGSEAGETQKKKQQQLHREITPLIRFVWERNRATTQRKNLQHKGPDGALWGGGNCRYPRLSREPEARARRCGLNSSSLIELTLPWEETRQTVFNHAINLSIRLIALWILDASH